MVLIAASVITKAGIGNKFCTIFEFVPFGYIWF